MKEFVRYTSKVLLKFILHVFWMFPLEDNKITLLNELSFSYGDSMKYLDVFIRNNYGEKYTIVYPIKEGQIKPEHGEIVVEPMTIKYFMHMITSRVIVTNAGGVSYIPKRKRQMIISTWHGGGPYKKTGTAVYKTKWYEKETLLNSRNIDFIMSTCRYFSDFEAKAMMFDDKQVIQCGTPRNDIFFEERPSVKEKVYEYCKLKNTDNYILYAPTFRSNVGDYTSEKQNIEFEIDYEQILKELSNRFGGDWRFAVRLHPKLKSVELGDDKIINLTEYPDVQELLYSAGGVITDYSSLMWDYSLTGKPCFLYAPDIEEYERTRGFYMPSKKWPFPIAHNNDELIMNIRDFDGKEYIKKIKIHHLEAGSFETGTACERVVGLIEK